MSRGKDSVAHPVFISYAHSASASAAKALSDALGPGVAFIDKTHLDYGGGLPTGLAEALLGARVVMVFATARYFGSWYCRRELRLCLAPYDALVGAGAASERREAALAHVVVALPSLVGAEVVDRLPPELRRRLWPAQDETEKLAKLVRSALECVPSPLGDRMEAQGLGALVRAFVEQAGMAASQEVAGMPVWGPPGEPQPSLGDGFVGRAGELWKIHDMLHSGGPNVVGLTGSVEGGGGFGKTRLATEYLHRYGPTFHPGGLFWVRADLDRDPQLHGMLSYLEPATPDLKSFTESGRDAWAELGAALTRRASEQSVLYVVDNVPEPPPGQRPQPLSTWCPAVGRVALLATSRAAQTLTGAGTSLRVEPLDADPAVELLTRGYARRGRLAGEDWERIAGWVGNLPLALEILNASLRARAFEPEGLLAMVSAPPVAEVDRIAEVLAAVIPVGSLRGITEALMASYESLDPATQRTARLLAQLGAFPIPLAILEALGPDCSSPGVRATLVTRSLVTEVAESEDGVSFLGRMHPVLADFLRARAPDHAAERLQVCEAVAEVMHFGHWRDPRSWPMREACLPHADELFRSADLLAQEGSVQVAVGLGLSIGILFSAKGLFHRSAEVGNRVLQLAIQSDEMGPGHPDTLTAMNNLAAILHAQGDLPGARSLHEQTLDACRRLLGDDHPDTLKSMNNLAATLHAQGDLPGARSLHEQTLDASRRLLGDDHPDTLLSMNNLAEILRAQGDLPGARRLQEQALDASRRLLGDDHPDTLLSMNNLAETLHNQGDLPGARSLHERVLDIRRRLLGDDHPDTLLSMNNLAEIVWAQGDLPGARSLHEQTFAACRRLLGNDHPDTLKSMNNLAAILHAQGDRPGARRLQEQALGTCRRLLGDDHPETLRFMNNLAAILRDQGDLPGARSLHEQTLDACRRLLGDDHPDTLLSLNNLAEILRAQGDLPGARRLQEQALDACRRLLGDDHPDTLLSMGNLAVILGAQGDLPGARRLHEQVLDIRRRLLADDHPGALQSMSNLALILRAQGDLPGARRLQEQALDASRRLFGDDHPDTLTTMSNLAVILHAQGDLPGARRLHEQVLSACRRLLGLEHPDSTVSGWNLYTTLVGMGDEDAAHAVLTERLVWLVDRDPETLSGEQRQVASWVRDLLDDSVASRRLGEH